MKIMYRYLGLLLLVLGIVNLFIAVESGTVNFGIFLIFPVLWGTGALAALSFILIFLGIIILFISVPYEHLEFDNSENKAKSKFGGFVLVGPFPIVFGSDKKIVYISIVLLILFVILLELYLFFRF
ncbi:MAG: TIGR00304 family membrane protein [Thermoplasmata archaeon]